MRQLFRSILTKIKGPRQSTAEKPAEKPAPKPAPKPPVRRDTKRGSTEHRAADPRSSKKPPASAAKKTAPRQRNRSRQAPRKPRSTSPKPQWDVASFTVPPDEGKFRFHDMELPDPVMHAIADLGFQYCTPIQAEIMPSTLKGKDATGRAQTGTGKTAAFLITVITRLLRKPNSGKKRPGTPQILILAPTRELVMQIADEAKDLAKYTDLGVTSIFGGMDYEKQRRQLGKTRNDIIVATPGRLLDFKRQRDLHLDRVQVLIIDEADRMLDMGFIPDVRKIIYSTPHKNERQTLLFSATLTPEVTRLAAQWTVNPVVVEIEPQQVAVDTVRQLVYIVTTEDKYALLYNIITQQQLKRVIVFCNRKDETRRLADLFERYRINCAVLSGDIRQRMRIRTLENFKAGKIRVLVATDVAGRGIHIEGMDHVVNYTLPRDPEDYVHRIGRTGRAGAVGTSISFADEEDSFFIPAIEKLISQKLDCIHPEEKWLKPPPPPSKTRKKSQERGTGGVGRSGNRRPRRSRRPRRPSGSHSRRSAPRRKSPAKRAGDKRSSP